jgi:hypothetical protein
MRAKQSGSQNQRSQTALRIPSRFQAGSGGPTISLCRTVLNWAGSPIVITPSLISTTPHSLPNVVERVRAELATTSDSPPPTLTATSPSATLTLEVGERSWSAQTMSVSKGVCHNAKMSVIQLTFDASLQRTLWFLFGHLASPTLCELRPHR